MPIFKCNFTFFFSSRVASSGCYNRLKQIDVVDYGGWLCTEDVIRDIDKGDSSLLNLESGNSSKMQSFNSLLDIHLAGDTLEMETGGV